MTGILPLGSLGNGQVRIHLESDDPEAKLWLLEFFGKAWGENPAGQNVDLRYRRVACAAEEMPSVGRSTQQRDGFTLHGSFSTHQAQSADGGVWFRDGLWDVIYARRLDGRFEVVASMGERRGRLALMRVVRELARDGWLRAGYLPLHASAFLLDGRAVMICGPRRSGKSSLLLHALRGHRAAYLSNDRVFVDNRLVVYSEPTIVAIRDGTLSLFPDLEKRFDAARYEVTRSLAECQQARPDPLPHEAGTRPGITPTQLCRLLDCPTAESGPLGLLLFPRVDLSRTGLDFEPIDPEICARLLLENVMAGHYPPLLGSDLFAREPLRFRLGRSVVMESFCSLAARVPAYQAVLGRDSFSRPLVELLPFSASFEPSQLI